MRTGPMKEEDDMAKWRDKNWRRKQYEARRDRGDDARGARRDLQAPTISYAARAEA
jgi:hypothetical protein